MSINYNGTIKSLRDIVWGVVTDPLSQIEQITLLIFIKLLSERHNELERLKAKKLIFTGDFASYHFDSISRLSGYELLDTTRKAIESLYKNPNIEEPIRRLYERSYLQVNDPRVLSLLVSEINKINLKNMDMGDFYEHLLSVLGTQKEAGQFRTPRHLIKFIVDIVDPQIGERVLDPACGTAGFLTAAYTHIRDANTSREARKTDSYLDKLNFDQKTFLLNKTIFGFDIDPKMIKFAISNLYLHNIKNPNISQHNTLTSNDSWEEKYDVILTNPPFSTPKGGVKPTDRFTLDSKRTEVLFAEYVIEHLTLNGRAGVIVPEGIIFQSGKAYKELRKWLVENNYLYAVVSLPSGVFNPYSGVKTSILFMNRSLAKRAKDILFVKVENDGFDLGAQRRPIKKNDLPRTLELIKKYEKFISENSGKSANLGLEFVKKNQDLSDLFVLSPKGLLPSSGSYSLSNKKAWELRNKLSDFFQIIEKKKVIESSDYNLSGDRYKETIGDTDQKWPMVELGDKQYFLIESGGTPNSKNKQYWNGGIAWVTLVDLPQKNRITYIQNTKRSISNLGLKNSSAKLLPINSVLVSSRATIGRIAVNQIPVATNQGFKNVIIKDIKKVDPIYLANMLFSKIKEMQLLGTGGTFKEISKTNFSKIKILLPPLSAQQQIVEELDGYQKIIDGAKQVVDNYKPQIKIDPKWQQLELGEICELEYGYTDTAKDSGSARFIRITDIDETGVIKDGDCKYTNITEKSKKYLLKENDILVARTGATYGKTAIFKEKYPAIFASFLIRLHFQRDKVLPDYYWIFTLSYAYWKQAKRLMTGGGQQQFNANAIKKIIIPAPPIKTQKEIITKAEEEQKLVEANKKLIQLFEQKIKDRIKEVWGG